MTSHPHRHRTALAGRRLLSALALAAALAGTAACGKPATPGADVWAVVNGKEIKRDEVEKYFRTRINREGPQPSHEESLSLKLNILEELMNNEILYDRARKLGLEAGDGEVEDKFTESKSPFTEEEFQRQLKDRGVSVDDLKQNLRRQITVQKLINREVVAKISITDQDVTDFYNHNRSQFNLVEPLFRIAQVVVTSTRDAQVRNRKNDDAGTDADARRKANALLQQLHAGADFAQVAMDYSEDPSTASNGGDIGYVRESDLSPPKVDPILKRAVLSLRPGEISGLLGMRDGYTILKLVSRESPGQRQLSDPQVQQLIRESLRSRKEQLLRAAYLGIAREESKAVNYLARQVLESSGKLPASLPPPAPPTQPAKK